MFKIGEPLNIEPTYNPNGETYKCRLVERNENRLYIDYPINEKTGKTVFLMNGTQLKASIIGSDSSVYMFDTQILGRTIQGVPMIIISFPGDENLIRIQRRQFVRVDTALDVSVNSPTGQFAPFVSITNDISAGGASVILPPKVRLNSGQMLNTTFVLPLLSEEYHYLNVKSEVIRVIAGRNGERDKVSLKFDELSENQRLLLIKICFERQVTNRKKGAE